MKARRPLRFAPLGLAGSLAAVSAVCLLLGFLAGRGADLALEKGWLEPRPLDLASAPEEQIERALLDAQLQADTLLDVSGLDLQFQNDAKASLIEVVAARGETGLTTFVAGYPEALGSERVGAAICAAARYDHAGPIEVLLSLEQVDPATLRCQPEGLKPSQLAKENDHGGVSRMLAKQGF